MPNFFKKLTGSLKMPEDDSEFFEEEAKEDAVQQENTGFTPEPEEESPEETPPAYEPEVEQKPDLEPEISSPSEAIEDDLDVEEEDEISSDNGEAAPEGGEPRPDESGREDKPYTIAQLAQATTTKTTPKKSTGKSTLSRLKPFAKKSKEKVEEKEIESEPEGQLAIDVYETPSDIIIKSTIAGVDPKDLDIGIEENTVNIRGSRHAEREDKGADYFYQECYWGTFSRSIILPVEVNSDESEASLKNGVLTIKLPKVQREKEKKIKVLG